MIRNLSQERFVYLIDGMIDIPRVCQSNKEVDMNWL